MKKKEERFLYGPVDGIGVACLRRRYALLFRVISVFVILAFITFDITWAQGGGTPIWQHARPKEIDPQAAKANGLSIPYAQGTTQEVYKGKNGQVVINIQDAHASLSAQHSIVNLLDHLVANYDLNMIAVEGSEGYIDTSLLRTFPDKKARKEAAEYLMREGRMSAGEFFTIVSDKPIALYGVEDSSLYKENVEAFKSVMAERAKLLQNTEALSRTLEELEDEVYSEELKSFLTKSHLHREEGLAFSEYWKSVSRLAAKNKVNAKKHENIAKLLASIKLEGEINFSKANDERRLLIDELSKTFTKEKLELLVTQSLSFKMGQISQGVFHTGLIEFAEEEGIDAKPYKNLINFTRYVSIYESIDVFGLYHEIELLEEAIREKLFRNTDERELYQLKRQSTVLKKLFSIELANGDVDYLTKNRKEFKANRFASFIRSASRKHSVQIEGDYDLSLLMDNIDQAASFYNVAKRRDEEMLKNTIKRMKDENQEVAALITGGFHTEGLVDLMKSKGLSYLVVVPKYEDQKERPYIAILTGKTDAYEKLVEEGKYELAVHQYYSTGKAEDLVFSVALAVMGTDKGDLTSTLDIYRSAYESAQEALPDFKDKIVAGKRLSLKDFRLVVSQFTEKVQEALKKIKGEHFNQKRALDTIIKVRKKEIEANKKRGRIKTEEEYERQLEKLERVKRLLLLSKVERNRQKLVKAIRTLEDSKEFKSIVDPSELRSKFYSLGDTGIWEIYKKTILEYAIDPDTQVARYEKAKGIPKVPIELSEENEFDVLNNIATGYLMVRSDIDCGDIDTAEEVERLAFKTYALMEVFSWDKERVERAIRAVGEPQEIGFFEISRYYRKVKEALRDMTDLPEKVREFDISAHEYDVMKAMEDLIAKDAAFLGYELNEKSKKRGLERVSENTFGDYKNDVTKYVTSDKDRAILRWAALLHDIAKERIIPEVDPHPQGGAEISKRVLSHPAIKPALTNDGLNGDDISLIVWLVGNHDVFGNVDTGERTARHIFEIAKGLESGERKRRMAFLRFITLCDMKGTKGGIFLQQGRDQRKIQGR
ncbi:MAG: hypothetical protein ACE5JK_00760 [Candidatus Omnitrophota bacterium]